MNRPEPADDRLRRCLEARAAGLPGAVDAVVREVLPELTRRLPGVARATVAAAARRVLTAAPAFVTSQSEVLLALLARLVHNDLAAVDVGPALPQPDHGEVSLDLDRGEAETVPLARTRAWLHLGLLLLTPSEQRQVVSHWRAAAPPAMPDLPAIGRSGAERLKRVVDSLRRGDVTGALAAAAAADAWGATTQWSLVLGAARTVGPGVHNSWRQLLQRYGPPIRASVRRLMPGRPDVDEVADDFFAYLFEQRVLAKAGPERGRFRAYVQAVLRRYVMKRLRQRGAAAELPTSAPADAASAAIVLAEEKAWAEHVLQMALAKVVQRTPRDGEILLRAYGIPWPGVAGSPTCQTSEEIARTLATTAAAVDQASYRARRLLRQCIESELGETVASRADRDHELALMEKRLLEAHPGLL